MPALNMTDRMARFHSLEVTSVQQETPECIVVGFRIPAAEQADFAFVHGQYLTLKLTVNGEELRRSYSICSSPLDKEEVRIAVKKVAGGRASTQLVDKLKPGMRIELPFWPIAAGLGFAALAAIFRYGAKLQHDQEGLI